MMASMPRKAALRLKHALVLLLLTLEWAGPRLYTAQDALGGARSFVGPNACYAGIPDGLEKISKGTPFARAFREFFSETGGASAAISERDAVAKIREFEKASSRAEGLPSPRLAAVPVASVKKPFLSAALALNRPLDTSPLFPFHVASKK